ncbi:MAG: hypothetical protein ABIU10_08870 [Sphingomicrobium sp.]
MLHQDKRAEAEAFIDKVIAPARAAAVSDPAARRARTELAYESRELAKRELAEGGLNAERLDKFAEARSKLRKKLAEEERRRAVDRSADAARRLADLGQFIFPADPTETVIDEVTFIRSFAGQGSVINSNIAPGDNWAQYKVRGDGDEAWDGTGRLSFFTLWQNPFSSNVFVTPRTSLSVNAHLSCDADWSGVADWFGLGSEARATVHARTTVWGMDASQRSVVDDRDLGNVSVSGGFFGDDASHAIEFADVLQGSGLVVVPNAFMLFEVEVATEWHANGGASVTLDAESGSHLVSLSQMVLGGVGTQPPMSIVLSVTVSVVAGGGVASLSWSGASGAQVEVYHNGTKIGDVANSGTFGFSVPSGTHQFRICETGASRCSNDVTVTIP